MSTDDIRRQLIKVAIIGVYSYWYGSASRIYSNERLLKRFTNEVNTFLPAKFQMNWVHCGNTLKKMKKLGFKKSGLPTKFKQKCSGTRFQTKLINPNN